MWPIEQVRLAAGDAGTELLKTGVDWDAYCNIPAMNPSTLVAGTKSMRHLRYAWEHPRADTDNLLWGRAVHCLLFEPKEFEHRYIAWREVDKDGKPKKRIGTKWDEVVKTATELSLEILSLKQWDSALEAAQSFVKEPDVQELIKAGQGEVTLLTTECGIQCRGRVDWIATGLALTDLKTTKNIEAAKFGRDFYAFHYDIKLGLYRRWLNRLTGKDWPVKCITLENTPPYDVAVVPVAEEVLDQGAAKGLGILARLRTSIDTGLWPGIAGGQEYYLETPAWHMEDVELSGAEEYHETEPV